MPTCITTESETRFFVRNIDLVVEFVPNTAGSAAEFVVLQGTRQERDAREVSALTAASEDPDGSPGGRGRTYGALDVSHAIEAYAKERRAQVSPRMVATWTENSGRSASLRHDAAPPSHRNRSRRIRTRGSGADRLCDSQRQKRWVLALYFAT